MVGCYFCGGPRHSRKNCPARSAICKACGKKGHYAAVCQAPAASKAAYKSCRAAYTQGPPDTCDPRAPPSYSYSSLAASCGQRRSPSYYAPTGTQDWRNHCNQGPPTDSSESEQEDSDSDRSQVRTTGTGPDSGPGLLAQLASVTLDQGRPHHLAKSTMGIKVNGRSVNCLFDSGSTESFIHPAMVSKFGLTVHPADQQISLASQNQTAVVSGVCYANLTVQGADYNNFKLYVLPHLCAAVLLGLDFQCHLHSLTISFGGPLPPLTICSLATLRVSPQSLFANLTPDCRPIATKSRHYSAGDQAFIKAEVKRLLSEGVIEASHSPWRAQVVVVKTGEKSRMVVDYSQTINRFTQLDAYPLPRISDMVNQIARYRVFSTIDLKSAYHQLPIRPKDRPYTAFEADGRLYQFLRVPFGVTNGVSVFQREMDRMVDQYGLRATFPYLDNITICGHDQQDHDANLAKFLQTATLLNLTYNKEKCVFRTSRLQLLGYIVEHGALGPDPDRMRPLTNLPLPHCAKALKRCLGFFSYYSQWVPHYADKARPLMKATTFPLSEEARLAFDHIKAAIAKAAMQAVDESVPFQVESDASDFALAATLNQNGRPVAFFSRTLHGSELRHSSVEKEAQAIVEAVRHWRHYLAGRRFTLLTDQRSVAFMFDNKQRGKIKNDKILRWRIELSTYAYDILYRPGRLNEPPDALSRGTCASAQLDRLRGLHADLCHPGVTRFFHYVKAHNLPYSVEEVRTMTRDCQICAECKPHFYRPDRSRLIKATRSFERLSLDFKGPLPSSDRNVYFLTVVDEYSRFPFAIPCPDMTAATVIKALDSIFALFGFPGYIHSDRGSSFMSEELRRYLLGKGIAASRTTSYNPRGNGQVEKENGTIWKAVLMALRSRGLPTSQWQQVIPDALHSIRSLLCTATNTTPHERLFSFPREPTPRAALPSWLTVPGPVLLRKHVRTHKSDPLVEKVRLIQANPKYAHVAFRDGREDTVSLRDLAPMGAPSIVADPPSSSSPPGVPVSHGPPAIPKDSPDPLFPPPPLPMTTNGEATPPTSPAPRTQRPRHPQPEMVPTTFPTAAQPPPLRRSLRTIKTPVRFDPSDTKK